ncbi:putative ATP-dependent RNA helicase TDRD12 [Conger conger]|uniref:putative ATP-dependent RNA helicase TDRD12 n=1 Tax=Conger conger TaxID=82655 RepID=UPI002A5AD63C|nr:putative ATP-dependent RNA helicase TDRD12 [Conger conger]
MPVLKPRIQYEDNSVFSLDSYPTMHISVNTTDQSFSGDPEGVDTMLEISILKIQDPGCFWGRIVKGDGLKVSSPREYEDLHVRMNLFYHDVNLDVQKIRPPSLAERQVCVVYSPALRCWCRAVVEAILGTVGSQVMCFLVDHAEHILVSPDSVRAPLEKFLMLPFWVRQFQLAGIRPMRLLVPVYQEKAKLVPSTHWDSSATRYLHSLVQASSVLEAVLCEVLGDTTAVELYLTVRNVKVCVNDDLVAKKFACFSSNKSGSSPHDCPDDPSPIMLSCDIFSNGNDFLTQNGLLTQNGCLSRALCSSISPRKDLLNGAPEASRTVVGGLQRGTEVQCRGTSEPRPQCSEKDAGDLARCAVGGGAGSDGDVAETDSDSSEKPLAGASSDGGQVDGSYRTLETETQGPLADELLNKLNLFRFMKLLNPVTKREMAKPQTVREEKTEVDSVKDIPEEDAEVQEISPAPSPEGVSVSAPPPDQVWYDYLTRRDQLCTVVTIASEEEEEEEEEEEVEEAATASTEQPSLQEELDCTRLLQLLNPDPLNPDPECLDSAAGAETPCEPSRSGILLHSAIEIDPCTSLARSPITDNIRKALLRKGFSGPRVGERFCWPAVARGSDTLLISGCGADPLSYVPPLLSHLHLSACSTLTSRTGPVAVILCHGWEKAQRVFDLLEDIPAAEALHPMIVLVGEKDEAKSVKIQRNCQVLVTTPCSLARLLGFHCFLFLRLCHLVLDEVELLFSKAPEEMAVALQHFQKAAAGEERGSCCRQVVAVGRQWSRAAEGLVRQTMSDPTIIITVMEEAALYGGVHQMVLLCLDCTKVSVLLGTLDFTPEVSQKTLIITNTVEEVEHVFQAVNNTAAFCLKVHEGLTYQFDFVIEQWRKPIGPGTHVILVMTNACLKPLAIRDATVVVHYGFPDSPRLFGSRLCCLSQNFQNLSDKDGEQPPRTAKSVLLLSERDARHVIGVLSYLERAEALLPPELRHFAQGVLQAKEAQKTHRPLCSYLKSFGSCRDSRTCPDRHRLDPRRDAPQHPESGNVVVVPLYIKNASCYYGRIVSRKEGSYESLAAEMVEYYATEKFNAKEVVEGGIYGILEDGVYHRVRVLAMPDKGERLFCSVSVCFLDEGREQEVKAHQLLTLPGRLHSLPPQALEIVVCRAKPIDGEVDWNPKVNRCISQKIKGVEHHAKIVLSLGNTVWLDPMVRITRLPGLKTSINEYNVRSEILATGMGCTNPEHLELLRALWQEASASASPGAGEPSPNMQWEGPEAAQESRLESTAEALADGLQSGREELDEHPTESPPGGPAPPLDSGPPAPLGASATRSGSALCLGVSVQNGPRAVILGALECEPGPPAVTSLESGVQEKGLTAGPSCSSKAPPAGRPEEERLTQTTHFHPHIKWYEREDSVMLNIKLLNPTEQKCEFSSDRVLYSARVGGRRYRADLPLSGRIVAGACSWEVRGSEPVVRMVKERNGAWNTLLTQKSPFVTFDFDHFEGDEPAVENMASETKPFPVGEKGRCFVESTGEDGCYVRSDCDSETDSD